MAHLLSRMSSRRIEAHTSVVHRAFWVVTGEVTFVQMSSDVLLILLSIYHLELKY